MAYAKEVDIANDDNEYSVSDNVDNEPLAEGNEDYDAKYASATSCAESIMLSAMPPESMIL
jgi:hypothetical protein